MPGLARENNLALLNLAARMLEHGFRHLPIVDGERAVGIVSIRDILRWTQDA